MKTHNANTPFAPTTTATPQLGFRLAALALALLCTTPFAGAQSHGTDTLFGKRIEGETSPTIRNKPNNPAPAARAPQQELPENSGANSAASAPAPRLTPLQKEFEELKQKHFAEISEALKPQNEADAGRLEVLRKRVGMNDIEFVIRLDEAIKIIKSGGALDVETPSENAPNYERDLFSIAAARTKILQGTSSTILQKNKGKFTALQERAFDARDYNLVKTIKAFLEGESPSASSSSSSIALRAFRVSDLDLEMLPIRAGSFQMGSNTGESNERPVHKVTITKPFWLGKYPVTQAQYQTLMGHNPSDFKKNGTRVPVEKVSWHDATKFCKTLNERERAAKRLPAGYEYSLPTEAQWEYACRAGTAGDYSFDGGVDALYRHGNYREKSNTNGWPLQDKKHNDGHDKTSPVGSYKPNA